MYKPNPNAKQKKTYEKFDDINDIQEEIWLIYGDIVKEVIIDDEQFWNIDDELPYRINMDPHSLPSDSRYREDLLWLKYENQKYSQEWKNKLEVQQRHDKKQRIECAKKRKKKLKFIYPK